MPLKFLLVVRLIGWGDWWFGGWFCCVACVDCFMFVAPWVSGVYCDLVPLGCLVWWICFVPLDSNFWFWGCIRC